MLLQLKRPTRAQSVGLVPLIDVVFILLLFFMLATNFQRVGSVGLAVGDANEVSASPQFQWVSVRVGLGGVEVDGQPVSSGLLGAEVQRHLARLPGSQVLVFAQDEVPVQRVVSVMDSLRASGIRSATFSVQ